MDFENQCLDVFAVVVASDKRKVEWIARFKISQEKAFSAPELGCSLCIQVTKIMVPGHIIAAEEVARRNIGPIPNDEGAAHLCGPRAPAPGQTGVHLRRDFTPDCLWHFAFAGPRIEGIVLLELGGELAGLAKFAVCEALAPIVKDAEVLNFFYVLGECRTAEIAGL